MRVALRQNKTPAGQIAYSKSYPAPVGGWNGRDVLAHMPQTDAVVLDEWFPRTSYVELRGGWTTHATGMIGLGKTLMVYNSLTGANTMYCTTNSGVYPVSTAGAVANSLATRTNGKHQWTMFGDGTSQWLIAVNGVDNPLYFNGTTWTAVSNITSPAITGVAPTSIIGVNVFKSRLFFIVKDSLKFYYLPSGVAGGLADVFDLSSVASKGGYLMAMGTWTVDAGSGPDDRAVFVTSEGEVLVYLGNNPANASAWALAGRFTLPKPLGRRCLAQYGSDLIIITQNGTFPMTAALQSAAVDSRAALSNKIENPFTDAARTYGANFGWSTCVYPAQSALLVNVPIAEDGEHHQYCMNTITGSWCRFKKWPAEDFAVFNKELYYVTASEVRKAWTGPADGEAAIECYGKTAFTYLNGKGDLKQIQMFQPVLAVNGTLEFLTALDIDFQDAPIQGTASSVSVTGAFWDTDRWDQASWTEGAHVVQQWTSPASWPGRCVAGKVTLSTKSLAVQWMASNYTYTTGGIL